MVVIEALDWVGSAVDLLQQHQNGYDGVLVSMRLSVTDGAVRCACRLRVVSVDGRLESWSTVRVLVSRVESFRLDESALEGGGGVLYNGARLFASSDGRVALDLDPGVAWLTTSAVSSPSRFFVAGFGQVDVRPLVE